MTPKSIETHNQLETLLGTYSTLLASISDTLVPVFGGDPISRPSAVPQSVRSLVESTLLEICSTITTIVQDRERWTVVDTAQLRALIEDNYRANLAYLQSQKIAADLGAQLAASALASGDTEIEFEIEEEPTQPVVKPAKKNRRKKQ